MPTKKELIQDHQARLDAAFAELYPAGRFTIQRMKATRDEHKRKKYDTNVSVVMLAHHQNAVNNK